MFIRIPGDKANDADYADQAVSFETLAAALEGLETDLGSYDVATILDATTHPVRVVAKAEGFSDRQTAERAMLNVAASDGGTATVKANGFAAVMVWVAD